MTASGNMLAHQPVRHSTLTNAIALAWGVSFTYVLVSALFISHEFSSALASTIPLIVVWATFERKRWGRFALLGLSVTMLGLFLEGHLYYAFHTVNSLPESLTSTCARLALGLYADNAILALLVISLALFSIVWLYLPTTIQEFEKSKLSAMSVAQRAIALFLVCLWGLQLVCSPLV